MSDIAIQVENLGKVYRLGQGVGRGRYRSARDSVARAGAVVAGRLRRAASRGEADGDSGESRDFWALHGVSFEVQRGEVVGVIGRNGAGKSTLLKILSQITEPTAGRVKIAGRVASLLEVGTGFHPELTGRENIYLNGAILGMSRRDIRRQLDEIVAFAEVERFVDTPVKHFSTGMYLRLAFSVAAHLEPDILLVDEVLAVGDAAFQAKCMGRMGEVAGSGRTVLLVSHNLGAISKLCSSAVWLDKGAVASRGSAREAVVNYLRSSAGSAGERIWIEGIANAGVREFELLGARILDPSGAPTAALTSDQPFSIELEYRVHEPLTDCRVGFLLGTLDGTILWEAYDTDRGQHSGRRLPGRHVARCTIPGGILNDGLYALTVNAGMPNVKNLAHVEGALTVRVEGGIDTAVALQDKRQGLLRPTLFWESEEDARNSAGRHVADGTSAGRVARSA